MRVQAARQADQNYIASSKLGKARIRLRYGCRTYAVRPVRRYLAGTRALLITVPRPGCAAAWFHRSGRLGRRLDRPRNRPDTPGGPQRTTGSRITEYCGGFETTLA
jgi:hypothetical protein